MKKNRMWRQPMENPVDPVENWEEYQGFQKIINSNHGQVNPERLEEHIQLIMADPKFVWEEISPVDFSSLKLGDRVRYVTKDPKNKILFRTGGWVKSIGEDLSWLAYHSHTHTSWTMQLSDIQRLWVTRKVNKKKTIKEPRPKKLRRRMITFPVPTEMTEYNVFLPDKDGILRHIKSFKDNASKKKFESTKKFKELLEGREWRFEEETQEEE